MLYAPDLYPAKSPAQNRRQLGVFEESQVAFTAGDSPCITVFNAAFQISLELNPLWVYQESQLSEKECSILATACLAQCIRLRLGACQAARQVFPVNTPAVCAQFVFYFPAPVETDENSDFA